MLLKDYHIYLIKQFHKEIFLVEIINLPKRNICLEIIINLPHHSITVNLAEIALLR